MNKTITVRIEPKIEPKFNEFYQNKKKSIPGLSVNQYINMILQDYFKNDCNEIMKEKMEVK